MHNEKKLNPFNIVVFGGDGDLAFERFIQRFFTDSLTDNFLTTLIFIQLVDRLIAPKNF